MTTLLTTQDVADQLGVSPVSVIRLADSGALPAVEIVKRKNRRILRFRLESLEKFITSREQRGNKEAGVERKGGYARHAIHSGLARCRLTAHR